MLEIQILIGIAVFIILLLSDAYHPLLCSVLLLFFYLWGFIAFDYTVEQKIFYPLGILTYIAIRGYPGFSFKTNATSIDLNGQQQGGVISGLKYHMFSIVIGIIMLIMMFMLGSSKGEFLGVAPLAMGAVGFKAWVTSAFAPAISLSIGFIENRLFIALFNVLNLILPFIAIFVGPIAFLFPLIITSGAFAIFHVVAYAVKWKLMMFAMIVMAMWLLAYLKFQDITHMDVSHGFWNGWLTSKETLSIAI